MGIRAAVQNSSEFKYNAALMCSLAIQLCTKHKEYFLLEAPRKKEIARFGTKKIIISGPLCGCWWHNVFSLMAKHT